MKAIARQASLALSERVPWDRRMEINESGQENACQMANQLTACS